MAKTYYLAAPDQGSFASREGTFSLDYSLFGTWLSDNCQAAIFIGIATELLRTLDVASFV